MTIKFVNKRAFNNVLRVIFVLIFMLSTATTVKASENVLTEIRSLIKDQYVELVSTEVLNAPTVDEMLKRLDDPHTMYLTPEQYQEFVGSIDMRFIGIGIHMEMLPEGVKVLSVISGSPAEEVGLQPGDVIISAAGQSLGGLTTQEALSLLQGLEGSSVQLRVKRESETRDLSVTRRAITEPTVTGEVLGGHIGYLDLNSFGSDTPQEFKTMVNFLKDQNVDSWIIDLRDNGGGYLSSALDLTSYFIGSDIAGRFKDRTGALYPYWAQDQDLGLNQRIIVLINENSASASEILAAALKDHERATLVGTNTYGKGTVQSMFPLENGGVLKMTVDHFYSPLGYEIDEVGVSPNIVIQQADSLKAAELMVTDSAEALALAKTEDYWEAWRELSGFSSESSQQTSLNYIHYYPGYRLVGELPESSLYKIFTVQFSGQINWQSVNNSSIELINSNTGERTLSTFEPLSPSVVQVTPQDPLTPDTTYWLVIHPTIQGVSGQTLQEGGLVVVQTMKGEETVGTSRIQSWRVNPQDPGYGLAIKD